MPVFKIVWYDIDDPDSVENEEILAGTDAETVSYDFAYDCSASVSPLTSF
jgi:hypothetical protein